MCIRGKIQHDQTCDLMNIIVQGEARVEGAVPSKPCAQTVSVTGVAVWQFAGMAKVMRAVGGHLSFGDCHSEVMVI